MQIYTGFHVNSRCSYQILIKLESSQQIFKKFSNIKFYENPSSLNRVVSYKRTDIKDFIVGFRTITKEPKKWLLTRRVQLNKAGSCQRFMKQILTNSKKYSSSWESVVTQLTHKFYTSYTHVGSLLYSKSQDSSFCLLLNEFSSYFNPFFLSSTLIWSFHWGLDLSVRLFLSYVSN
jgi:hypothetical protein